MPTPILLQVGNVALDGELDDSATGKALAQRLPLNISLSRWGEEYYGSVGAALGVDDAPDAREIMKIGELAYWLPGNALCIFFGPTPASSGTEPRAASPVNPAGMLKGDIGALKKLGASVKITLTRQPGKGSKS
jgi:hypothetical protein